MHKPKKIRLYSTTTCPYCKMEKAWLEQNNVEFDFVLVDRDHQEAEHMVRSTGQMGVPVTELQYEGHEPAFIIGFDRPALAHYLGIKNA